MSSNFFNKVLYFMGIGDNMDDEVEEQEIAAASAPKPQMEPISAVKKSNVVNLHSASLPMKVVVVEPTNYDEVQDICNNLKSKKPIIINFENIDKDVARRMVDFISGAVFALDGTIQKVSNGIVVVAPSNVDIMANLKNGIGKDDFDIEGIFSWLK